MAEVCYTAQATTKQQVLDGINKLTLQTNEHGQYMHNAILLLQKDIQHILVSQFNPSDPGKGMVKLLDNGDNILMRIQSTDVITAGSVLKSAKKRDVIGHGIGGKYIPIMARLAKARRWTKR